MKKAEELDQVKRWTKGLTMHEETVKNCYKIWHNSKTKQK